MTLDPIVANVEKRLRDYYENTVRLELLCRNVATETQEMKDALQPAVDKIILQQQMNDETLRL